MPEPSGNLPGSEGLTLVIPSHNEGGTLGPVVRDWWQRRPSNVPVQFLVVDDCSSDETSRVLQELAKEGIPVDAFRSERRLGFGGALRAGIQRASTPWVAFTDADGQYDPQDLPILLATLSAGNDIAIGLRSPRADPFLRRALSIGFRGLLYAFFGLRSKDPTTSLKAGPTEAIRTVAEQVRFMNGSFWNEFMLRWTRAGHSYAEVPVRHRPRAEGLSKVASRTLIVRASVQQFIALLRAWREFHRSGPFAPASSPSASERPELSR